MTTDGSIVAPLNGVAVPVGIRVGASTRARSAVESPSAPVVQVEALTKRFGEVLAVDNLSFALRMLLGLAAPSTGRALIFGKPYAQLADAAHGIGAVLEATDFDPGWSGRDHLRMLGRAVGIPDRRDDEVLRLGEVEEAASFAMRWRSRPVEVMRPVPSSHACSRRRR